MTGEVRTVNPLDVMRKSRRFDLIFKVELAAAWGAGNASAIRKAEEAYLEMVRARNGFLEHVPLKNTPCDFIDKFREVAEAISQYGYNCQSGPIPLDANGEVLNGAHRLSACIAYGKPCPVSMSEQMSSGGSGYAAFLRGKIHPAVAYWGMRAYLRRLPDGCLAEEFKAAVGPDMPFPDWTERAREFRLDSLFWRLREKLYLAKAVLRKGTRRAKSLKNADECRHRAAAPFALARYWEEHG